LYKEDDGLESDHTDKDDSWYAEVIRMNKLGSEHRIESRYMAYGNEHQLKYVYGSVSFGRAETFGPAVPLDNV